MGHLCGQNQVCEPVDTHRDGYEVEQQVSEVLILANGPHLGHYLLVIVYRPHYVDAVHRGPTYTRQTHVKSIQSQVNVSLK